jgi:amino acid transporter
MNTQVHHKASAKDASAFEHGVLGELPATAICGNDITSSCLYVSSLSIIAAGQWAPVSLLIVAVLLYLFRTIYAEVVGALPLNGGAYNALLNTTSKFRASVAACLTILSYMATAVISANEAIHYADHLWHGIPVIPVTIGLLALFMILSIIGITESAAVAVGIFLFHIATLTTLLCVGGFYVFQNGTGQLIENYQQPLTAPNLPTVLFLGFCAAMLGISGFESSSNFVEEQKEGVFPKTLRNMWLAVSFFNPMMALLALSLIPMGDVENHKETLLSHMGEIAGGNWLSWMISIDAILVLSGAVLTSYVGVNGLVRRMTLDRCLPQFLLKTNSRGTTHRIIIAFFALAVSVLIITNGVIEALAGVYILSFLSVMALFALGNVLLKVARGRLPRPVKASWIAVIIAMTAVMAGLIGNAVINPEFLVVFLQYFIPAMAIIMIMLGRITILKGCLFIVRTISTSISRMSNKLSDSIREKIEDINSQQMVFFTRGDNIANLNNAMLYVNRNEQTNRIKFVTVAPNSDDVPSKLAQDIDFLDKAYPDTDIEFVLIEGTFGPDMIQQLSEEWDIPTNLMFIGSHGGAFQYNQAKLGGVRLIV